MGSRSSLGANVSIPPASAIQAGTMAAADFSKLAAIGSTVEANLASVSLAVNSLLWTTIAGMSIVLPAGIWLVWGQGTYSSIDRVRVRTRNLTGGVVLATAEGANPDTYSYAERLSVGVPPTVVVLAGNNTITLDYYSNDGSTEFHPTADNGAGTAGNLAGGEYATFIRAVRLA